jgi:hypothetical protein
VLLPMQSATDFVFYLIFFLTFRSFYRLFGADRGVTLVTLLR